MARPWAQGTDDETRTAYLDTQDVAKMTLAAVRRDEAINKVRTHESCQAEDAAIYWCTMIRKTTVMQGVRTGPL